MNAAVELGTIVAWWSTYHVCAKFQPSNSYTPLSGAAAGLTVAAISLPMNTRQFPELKAGTL
jgi:hypothetical protein